MTLLLTTLPVILQGQVRGSSTFEALNVPYTATLLAMGGVNVSWNGHDPMLFMANPALSDSNLSKHAGLNYLNFSGAYSMFSGAYHHPLKKGMISFGIRHFTFGEFEGFDAAGLPTGNFNVSNAVATGSYSLSQGNFQYGLSVNFLSAGITAFNATALSFSLGGIFVHPDKDLTVGLAAQNIGFVLSDFTSTSGSKLPWDVELGVTFKPEFMPFRFSVTGHHLFNTDILDNTISDSDFREVLSHMVVATEIIISKNISVLIGYNHLIRQELRLQQNAGGAGFSYGFQWKTNKFTFSYGRGAYHPAGATNVLSLDFNLNKIFRTI